MKVESKWFLSAVSAFVFVALITVLSGFSTFKTNKSKKVTDVYVSSITKIGNLE